MSYIFLVSFVSGVLFGVRLLFFGAERRRIVTPGSLPLRRSEPAIVAFLVTLGLVGYVQARVGSMSLRGMIIAVIVAVVSAAVVTRLAITAARLQPQHDPDDPRYRLQGQVGVVVMAISAGSEGIIQFEDAGLLLTARARDIGDGVIQEREEVCIDHLEDGVAYVERWVLVERRL